MSNTIRFLLSLLLLQAFPAVVCRAQSPAMPAALSQELVNRIKNEVRSRYSIPFQVKMSISEPKPSDVPGFDQIVVTFTATHVTSFDFLISKDRKTLAHLEKFDVSKDWRETISLTGRPVRGDAKAKVVIVNFDDFQCPFCARMHSTLFPDLLKAYGGRVKFVYKDDPLTEIHPWAMHAAVDANCLADQRGEAYWDFADYVHGNARNVGGNSMSEAIANLDRIATDQAVKHNLDGAKFNACMKKQDETTVRASMAEADKLGIDSTPTLFVNGERINGLIPEELLRSVIDRALADAGEKAIAPDAKTEETVRHAK